MLSFKEFIKEAKKVSPPMDPEEAAARKAHEMLQKAKKETKR